MRSNCAFASSARLLVVAAVLTFLPARGTAAATWTVCAAPGVCDFTTVSNAIAGVAAGDILELGAETFSETIVIDKDLSLIGEGATVTSILWGLGSVVTVNPGVIADISHLRIAGGVTAEGGGVHNSGALSLRDATVEGGFATLNGGGIWTEGDLTLDRVLVQSNGADPVVSPDGAGGGVYARGLSTVLIRDSVIDNNGARTGGGVYNGSALTMTIVRTSITNNLATDFSASGGAGGGVATQSGLLDIRNSTISGNTSHDLGGGVLNGHTAILSNTTVSGNTALDLGPAIIGTAGGIHNTLIADLTLNNVTVTDNDGSGLFNDANVFGASGVVTFRNSIIADQATGADCGGTIGAVVPNYVSAGWNIDSDFSCYLGAVGDLAGWAPFLDPLADNGGPTWTHNIDHLSPAVDAGDPAGCEADSDGDSIVDGPIQADQRGQIRVDSPSALGGPCDIGATEYTMLVNGMMEDDDDGDRRPDGWSGARLQGYDRLICRPAFANNGRCGMRMKGRGGPSKILLQTVNQIGLFGNTYEAAVYTATRNVPVGSLELLVRFEDAFGVTDDHVFPLVAGNHWYLQAVGTAVAGIVHIQVHVAIRSTMPPFGRFVVDDVSLAR